MDSTGWTCVFCGTAVKTDDLSASSFLFLARGQDGFRVVQDWTDESEHLQGRQYYCHAACFKISVSPKLRDVLFNDE